MALLAATPSRSLPVSDLRDTCVAIMMCRGKRPSTKDGKPSLKWVKLFLLHHKDILQRTSGVIRMSARRLAANGRATRETHFDLANLFFENRPIVGCGNLDESSCAAENYKEKMEKMKWSDRICATTDPATIPEVEFRSHLSVLTGVGVSLKDEDLMSDILEAMPPMPVLHVQKGIDHGILPASKKDYLPGSYTFSNKSGSVTKAIFEEYILKVAIPWIQKNIPGLKYGTKEFLLTFDLPDIHKLSASTLKLAHDAGIHILALPPHSTSWSQPCDSRYVFGNFKRGYYAALTNEMGRLMREEPRSMTGKKI